MSKKTKDNRIKEEEKIEIKTDKSKEKVILTATKNTYLADGTFVKRDEKVEVTREYAERLKLDRVKDFK